MAMSAPLRVVVFTGGAVLEDACVEFIGRIESDPVLELAGVFCEAQEVGLSGIVRDLFRRRRWLAPGLLLQRAWRRTLRILRSPRAELDRRRTLKSVATRIHFVRDLHDPALRERIAALQPGIGAVYGGPILRPALFELPAYGTIGIHHGLLPFYRGKKTTFWALKNGEDRVGVAIQRIGAGLDRGDILKDTTLPVGRKPLPRLTRELEGVGLDIFLEALRDVQRGSVATRPQPPGGGPMFKDPSPGEIARFWLRDLGRLLGMDPRARP
jgi:folate-dependent phosphoribosylglycinamide formyltransferase PurN